MKSRLNGEGAPARREVIEFMEGARSVLEGAGAHYPALYCELKYEFFARFQMGLVFSTRWNGDFFSAALHHVRTGEPLRSDQRNESGRIEPLGEWDENFNRWLKMLR